MAEPRRPEAAWRLTRGAIRARVQGCRPKRGLYVMARRIVAGALFVSLLVVCFSVLTGCKSMEEYQNELTAAGTPVISQIAPAKGPVGTALAVQGTNFGSTQGELAFQDPNTSRYVLATVTSWTNEVIVASVPTMDSATGSINVGLKTSEAKIPASPAVFTLTR